MSFEARDLPAMTWLGDVHLSHVYHGVSFSFHQIQINNFGQTVQQCDNNQLK